MDILLNVLIKKCYYPKYSIIMRTFVMGDVRAERSQF